MKKVMLIILVLFIVFIAGCKAGDDVGDVDSPYIGGSNGVDISFEATAPLAEFTQEDDVDVKVKVINEGEFEVQDGFAKVKLYGVAPSEFGGLNFDYASVPGVLFPAEKDIFEVGGQAVVDMGKATYDGTITNFVQKELYAKVCYPYSTRGSVEACITSQRIEELGGENVCSYTGEKIEDGFVSSGPIQITSFNEEPRGVNQIIFRIGFQNMGNGEIFNKDSTCNEIDSSFGKLQHENKLFVKITPESVLCSFTNGQYNEGYITLTEGQEKVLVCTANVDSENKYTQGIDISADYVYVESTSTEFKILENQ